MNIDPAAAPRVHQLHGLLAGKFPVFKKVVATRAAEFGAPWIEQFESELTRAFVEERYDWSRLGGSIETLLREMLTVETGAGS